MLLPFSQYVVHEPIIHRSHEESSRTIRVGVHLPYRAGEYWPKLTIAPTLRQSGFMAKPALGRGLGALLGGSTPAGKPSTAASPSTPASSPAPAPEIGERVQRIPLNRIQPCSFQPRKTFSDEALRELADSIKEQGIVQPLIVRSRGDHFELIAGERRWRASQLLGLNEVPVIVREADDRAVLELALIENLQRENLNAIEEAHGYAQLIEQFQLKQDEVATKVGKSRAVVANALRLLKLAPSIQDSIRDGKLSVGHAKAILGLVTEKQQKTAADRVLKEGLNVRQTEALVMRLQAEGTITKAHGGAAPVTQDANIVDLENRLREKFGTKVRLKYIQGKGSVEIAFFNDEDLERLLQIVGVKVD
jgi:ParB family transcriptional regulator, chromosome partitioning protein